jgi:hypothetical protein
MSRIVRGFRQRWNGCRFCWLKVTSWSGTNGASSITGARLFYQAAECSQAARGCHSRHDRQPCCGSKPDVLTISRHALWRSLSHRVADNCSVTFCEGKSAAWDTSVRVCLGRQCLSRPGRKVCHFCVALLVPKSCVCGCVCVCVYIYVYIYIYIYIYIFV